MKRIVILGAGESGIGAALLAKKEGLDVFVSDAGIIKPAYKNQLAASAIDFEEGNHSKEKILNASVVVKSPGIPEKNEMIKEIVNQRSELVIDLSSLKQVVKIYPSDANFILVKMKGASDIYNSLAAKGIIVRDRSKVILCDGCLRITVGTAAENEQLINELKAYTA